MGCCKSKAMVQPALTGGGRAMRQKEAADFYTSCLEEAHTVLRQSVNNDLLLKQFLTLVAAHLQSHVASEGKRMLAFKTRFMALMAQRQNDDDPLFYRGVSDMLNLVMEVQGADLEQVNPRANELFLRLDKLKEPNKGATEQQMLEFLKIGHRILEHMPADLNIEKGVFADRKNIARLADKTAGVYMYSLLRCNHSANRMVCRPAFVGMESIGKTTLINLFTQGVDSTKGEAAILPTGDAQVTLVPTLIKAGEAYRVSFGDDDLELDPLDLQSEKGATELNNQIQRKFKEVLDAREQGKIGRLDVPVLTVEFPFNSRFPIAGKLECMDVPGLNASGRKAVGTEADTSQALGLATCVTLCVGKTAHIRAQLRNGVLQNLPRMVEENSRVRINGKAMKVICIVSMHVEENNFDREEYLSILKPYFPLSDVEVLYGNLKYLVRAKIGEFVDSYFSALGIYESADKIADIGSNDERLVPAWASSKDMCNFLNQLEKPLKRHLDDRVGFSSSFQGAKQRCAQDLATYAMTVQNGSLIQDKDFSQSIGGLAPNAADMPLYEYICADGNVTVVRMPHIVHIQEVLLAEVRLKFLNTLLQTGERSFHGAWNSFTSLKELLGEKAQDMCVRWAPHKNKRRSDKMLIPHARRVPTNTSTKRASEIGEIVNLFMDCIDTDGQDDRLPQLRPSGSGSLKLPNGWDQAHSSKLNKYSQELSFPWFTAGYHMATIDEQIMQIMAKDLCFVADLPKVEIAGMQTLVEDMRSTMQRKLREWNAKASAALKAKRADEFQEVLVGSAVDAALEAARMLQDSQILQIKPSTDHLMNAFARLINDMLQRAFIKFSIADDTFVFTDFAEHLKNRLLGPKSMIQSLLFIMTELSCPDFDDDESSDYTKLTLKLSKDVQQLEVAVHYLEQPCAGDASGSVPSDLGQEAQELRRNLDIMTTLKPKICNQASKAFTVLAVFFDLGFDEPRTKDFMTSQIRAQLGSSADVRPVSLGAATGDFAGIIRSECSKYAPHIAVVFRYMGTSTADPDGPEIKVLKALAEECYISTQVWVSPDGREADMSRSSWTRYASGAKLESVEWKEAKFVKAGETEVYDMAFVERNLSTLCGKTVEEFNAYEGVMKGRRRSLLAEWRKAKMPVEKILEKFTRKAAEIPIDAATFKAHMNASKHKPKEFLTSWEKNLQKDMSLRFDMPDHQVLKDSIPEEFKQMWAGVFSDGMEVAKVNEQMVRAFFCKVLFGKSIDLAQDVAYQFNEFVTVNLLLIAADQWGISVDHLLDEMREFCISAKDQSSADILALRFLMPENLESMYVGSMVLSISPILHTMVEPCLSPHDLAIDNGRAYNEALKRAMDYYEKKSMQPTPAKKSKSKQPNRARRRACSLHSAHMDC